jgi:hypothetical protein
VKHSSPRMRCQDSLISWFSSISPTVCLTSCRILLISDDLYQHARISSRFTAVSIQMSSVKHSNLWWEWDSPLGFRWATKIGGFRHVHR